MKRSERKKAACGSKELNSPFPFPLRGKPGREGSPHAAQNAAPPTRGLRPLVNPPQKKSARSLDTTRPSHGSRDQEGVFLGPQRAAKRDEGAVAVVGSGLRPCRRASAR